MAFHTQDPKAGSQNGLSQSCQNVKRRSQFFSQKDGDAMTRLVWSFGYNGNNYLYSKEIEPYKKAAHEAILLDRWQAFDVLCPEISECCKMACGGLCDVKVRYLYFQNAFTQKCKEISCNDWLHPIIQANPYYKSLKTVLPKTITKHEKHEKMCIEGLICLQSFCSFDRIKNLSGYIGDVVASGFDYRDMRIPENSVVFCDPPYASSCVKYNSMHFDNDAFISWCIQTSKNHPVYVTEYEIDHPAFIPIGDRERQISMNSRGHKGMKAERLYKVCSGNPRQLSLW